MYLASRTTTAHGRLQLAGGRAQWRLLGSRQNLTSPGVTNAGELLACHLAEFESVFVFQTKWEEAPEGTWGKVSLKLAWLLPYLLPISYSYFI